VLRNCCFSHFDLQFASHSRAFQRLYFHKCSEVEVFCPHFDVDMWLRAAPHPPL
jgi:hypothetical protein